MTTQTKPPRCPACGGPLVPVTYPGGPFNTDQWESLRAACPPNDRSGYKSFCYWWDCEVKK